MSSVTLKNMDCMKYMETCKDGVFDLAIVDPPYGIGETWLRDRSSKFHTHDSDYKNKEIPDARYFKELFRVSKNQIIWGGNYYTEFLPATNQWIFWDKQRSYIDSHMSEGELAWHSFRIPMRSVKLAWNGFIRCGPRYGKHPHEKPVKLYSWLLENFAKPGQRIIDTHLGSGSSAIAAHLYKCDFVGIELVKQYYSDAVERLEKETKQLSLII